MSTHATSRSEPWPGRGRAVFGQGVGQWLHAKNRLLHNQRPVDLLAKDRYDEVRGAAEAFIDGAYV